MPIPEWNSPQMPDISGLSLPSGAMDMLGQIYQNQAGMATNKVNQQYKDVVGQSVANLANRGVLQGNIGEQYMGNVAEKYYTAQNEAMSGINTQYMQAALGLQQYLRTLDQNMTVAQMQDALARDIGEMEKEAAGEANVWGAIGGIGSVAAEIFTPYLTDLLTGEKAITVGSDAVGAATGALTGGSGAGTAWNINQNLGDWGSTGITGASAATGALAGGGLTPEALASTASEYGFTGALGGAGAAAATGALAGGGLTEAALASAAAEYGFAGAGAGAGASLGGLAAALGPAAIFGGLFSIMDAINKSGPRGIDIVQAYSDLMQYGKAMPQPGREFNLSDWTPERIKLGYRDYLIGDYGQIMRPFEDEHTQNNAATYSSPSVTDEQRAIADELLANPQKYSDYGNPFTPEQWDIFMPWNPQEETEWGD